MKQSQSLKHVGLTVALMLAMGTAVTTTNAKQYYKWVDSNGSTHYTTTPPPKNAKQKGKIDTYGWGGNSATTQHSSAPAVPAAPSAPTTAPAPQQNHVPAPVVDQQKEANAALQHGQNISKLPPAPELK